MTLPIKKSAAKTATGFCSSSICGQPPSPRPPPRMSRRERDTREFSRRRLASQWEGELLEDMSNHRSRSQTWTYPITALPRCPRSTCSRRRRPPLLSVVLELFEHTLSFRDGCEDHGRCECDQTAAKRPRQPSLEETVATTKESAPLQVAGNGYLFPEGFSTSYDAESEGDSSPVKQSQQTPGRGGQRRNSGRKQECGINCPMCTTATRGRPSMDPVGSGSMREAMASGLFSGCLVPSNSNFDFWGRVVLHHRKILLACRASNDSEKEKLRPV